jgi:hypothetical protein
LILCSAPNVEKSCVLIFLLACIALKVHASPLHHPSKIVRGGATIKVSTTMPLPIGQTNESKHHLAAAAVARSVSIYGMFPGGVTPF